MPTPLEEIQGILSDQFQPQHLEILDESDQHRGHAGARSGGGHFQVTLISKKFDGKSLLQQHQLVQDALKHLFPQTIHALALNTFSPEQWETQKRPKNT